MQVQSNAQAVASEPIDEQVESWENDGGAIQAPTATEASGGISGTRNQVEWAEQIKLRVDAEFDRVAAAIRSKAAKRDEERRAETDTLLCILDSIRREVMGKRDAGYFIRDWQDIDDQVRRLMLADERYLAIKARGKISSSKLRRLHELESKGKK